MICYMPFSYVEDNVMKKVTTTLGTVSVYGPSPGAMPMHMQKWTENGLLDWRFPQQIKHSDLAASMQDFKSWATLHQGKLSDMAAYFKMHGDVPPLVDETNPTRIGDQIRQYGKSKKSEENDPVFQAALFMAMAQEYDEQHVAIDQQIGDVKAMEKAMLSKLIGISEKSDESARLLALNHESNHLVQPIDRRVHMTEKRVQSWAMLVQKEQPSFLLYVTTSSAVFEYLTEFFPNALGPWRLAPPSIDGDEQASKYSFARWLEPLAQDKKPEQVFSHLNAQHAIDDEARVQLSLYVVAGLASQDFPGRLLGKSTLSTVNPTLINTLFAFIHL